MTSVALDILYEPFVGKYQQGPHCLLLDRGHLNESENGVETFFPGDKGPALCEDLLFPLPFLAAYLHDYPTVYGRMLLFMTTVDIVLFRFCTDNLAKPFPLRMDITHPNEKPRRFPNALQSRFCEQFFGPLLFPFFKLDGWSTRVDMIRRPDLLKILNLTIPTVEDSACLSNLKQLYSQLEKTDPLAIRNGFPRVPLQPLVPIFPEPKQVMLAPGSVTWNFASVPPPEVRAEFEKSLGSVSFYNWDLVPKVQPSEALVHSYLIQSKQEEKKEQVLGAKRKSQEESDEPLNSGLLKTKRAKEAKTANPSKTEKAQVIKTRSKRIIEEQDEQDIDAACVLAHLSEDGLTQRDPTPPFQRKRPKVDAVLEKLAIIMKSMEEVKSKLADSVKKNEELLAATTRSERNHGEFRNQVLAFIRTSTTVAPPSFRSLRFAFP